MKHIIQYRCLVSTIILVCLMAGGGNLSGQEIVKKSPDFAKIESFSLKNANDKTEISLDSFKNKQGIVLVFTSSHCAYSKNYVARLNQMYKEYNEKGIMFLAINSNDPAISQDDSFHEMAEQKPYDFPYLKDNDQRIAKLFKASKNPEAFVLVPEKDSFDVVYQGKIDDLPLKQENFRVPKQRYLANAIEAALAGATITVSETDPGGCNIKWKKE